MTLTLSPSRAADYRRCPLQYRLKAIDQLPQPTTVAQIRGTLVHKVLEDLFTFPPALRTYPHAVKLIIPSWRALSDGDTQLTSLIPKADEMNFFVECRELVKNYFRLENPSGFTPHGREELLLGELPSGTPVKGFMDRVDINTDGLIRIVDYKTGRKPRPQWAHDAIFQMRFYALVYWKIHGIIPTQLKLLYLKEAQEMTMTPTVTQLKSTERQADELWNSITKDGQTGNFLATPHNLCNWCAFKKLCPEFGGTTPEYPGWPDP